jgi:trans-2,3-dihydro-3-hydroxyanthranilate isomerase
VTSPSRGNSAPDNTPAYRFATADVFTDTPFGGNQLAVIPDARGLDTERMQAVAREFNYSETVFVFPPENSAHTRRLRIFTPAAELPFAGHPTVGTAFVLASLGEIPLEDDETDIVFEENVGPVPVRIRSREGRPVFTQLSVAKLPETGPPPPSRSALAELLSLQASDLLGGSSSPQAVSCGLPFLIVPLKDRDAVGRARIRLEKFEEAVARYWAPNIMVFSKDPESADAQIRARVFVPELAVPEDPATGSAAAALGGYLMARESADGTKRWIIEQGVEMGRPSRIEVEADRADGKITAVRVGGATVMVAEGTIRVPPRSNQNRAST